ncbi:MAG: hypothetical protein IPL39_18890 [Opitutaceae bacterium]|nr:hypothetical protein [Opitutaceae bacterium]
MTPYQFTTKLAELEIRWRAQGYPPTSKVPRETLADLRKLYARNSVEACKQLTTALKAGRQPSAAELERATKAAPPTKNPAPGAPAVVTLKKKPVAAAQATASSERPGEYRIRGVFSRPILA